MLTLLAFTRAMVDLRTVGTALLKPARPESGRSDARVVEKCILLA
jgi:hypothetical protein